MNVTIRDFPEDAFKQIKAFAVANQLKIGEALAIAVRGLKTSMSGKKKAKPAWFKSWSLGPGYEHIGEEADEILYGAK